MFGDWVECVDGSFDVFGSLTLGKKYRLISFDRDMTRVIDDDGAERNYFSHRFKLTSPPEPESKPTPPEVSCVRCYKNDGYEGSLTVGRLYEVVACPLGFKHVGHGTHILDDNGKFCWYDNAHFVEPKPVEKAEEPERWVRCVNNAVISCDLTVGRTYKVIRDSEGERRGYVRVINDRGSDVQYYASRFEDTDPPGKSIADIAKDIVEVFDNGLGATCAGVDPFLGVGAKDELAKLLTDFAVAVMRGSLEAVKSTLKR